MLDINLIRQKPDFVKKEIDKKYFKEKRSILVDQILKLDKKRKDLLLKKEKLQAEVNKLSKTKPDKKTITILKKKKEELKQFEVKFRGLDKEYKQNMWKLPNLPSKYAPLGKDESENIEVRRWGKVQKFNFAVKDHLSLAQNLDIIDFEAGRKVIGSKFYYFKNQGVDLVLALISYALDVMKKEKFTPFITPEVAKTDIVEAMGFQPRGPEKEIYELKDENLSMIGTAEITLGGLHNNEILNSKKFPIKYTGLSNCYRVEAGSWGKYSHGLYRVHYFNKIEMFVYTKPEDSDNFLEYLVKIEEKIFQGLNIPYRVVNICSGDLGAAAARKYDLEGWMPGRGDSGDWGEITSASNCTDYQARRLNTRFKDRDGKNKYLHTLNGTAIAVSRAIICILENYQQKDGSIKIPKVLQPYMNGLKQIGPK
jgi:seryl-tRNA synthetase